MKLKRTINIALAAVALAAAPASPAAITFGGYEYFLTTSNTTWQAAETEAVGMGLHLASIHSAAENNFVATNFPGYHWIGLNDIAVEGLFVWTDGSPVDYTNWATGEPNDLNGVEDVVMINFPFVGSGTWNDEGATPRDLQGIVKRKIASVPDGGTTALLGLLAFGGLGFLRRFMK